MERQADGQALIEAASASDDLRSARRALFPIGATITLADLEGYESGIQIQRTLREREPVTWFEQVQGWLVTPRHLVEEVLGDHERFSVHARPSLVRSVLGDHMLSRDSAGHRHERAPYDPPLRLRPVRQNYTGLIDDLATELLEPLKRRRDSELRAAYANPLAIIVAGRALGLAFDDIGRISEIYDFFAANMVDYSDPTIGATTAPARSELDAIVRRNIDRIRDDRDSSIISHVLTAEDPQLRHSDDEIIGNVRIILFGAIETVTSIILSTTWALLTHPGQLSEAMADPALFTAAVSEALRWISPVGHSERWAAHDADLGEVSIRRGEMVLPSIAAANRDPSFFPDPDAFSIHRENARHHASFGRGEHHCIGLNLGNLEAQIAVRRLFCELPDLRLDSQAACVPTGFGFRSPRQLWVTRA